MWRRDISERGEVEGAGIYDVRYVADRRGGRRRVRVRVAAAAVLVAGGLLLASAGDDMDFYRRQAADPAWLARAAEFHGHLGPWLVVGAMVGQDALKRLETRGYWQIEVKCSLPADKQRPPFTCLVDGLQASTGATMGKCNLHVVWEPERLGEAWPAVAVVRRAGDGRPAAGVVYRPLPALRTFLEGMKPDRLEEMSRELAGKRVEELFEVQPLKDPGPVTSASG